MRWRGCSLSLCGRLRFITSPLPVGELVAGLVHSTDAGVADMPGIEMQDQRQCGFTASTCCINSCSDNGVCCGLGKDDIGNERYFCAGHCSCNNMTSVCSCDSGWTQGDECTQQISPQVWLAVILTVGTLLVLFIAWGFRCNDPMDTTTMEGEEPHQRADPLLREGTERAAAAARPPTTRGDTTTDNTVCSGAGSCTGAGTSEAGASTSVTKRTCCVCLAKPLQVVLIPCGHACVCKRCSRKLDKCPLCRLDIQATQKIYF